MNKLQGHFMEQEIIVENREPLYSVQVIYLENLLGVPAHVKSEAIRSMVLERLCYITSIIISFVSSVTLV